MYYQGCICMCVCWGQTANNGCVSPLLLDLIEISNPESKSLEPCDPQCQALYCCSVQRLQRSLRAKGEPESTFSSSARGPRKTRGFDPKTKEAAADGSGLYLLFLPELFMSRSSREKPCVSKLKGVSACLTHKEPKSQNSLLFQLTSLETWYKFLGPGSSPVKGAEF